VDEIERPGRKLTGEKVVLQESDVAESLRLDERSSASEHLVVDVGSDDASLRANPFTQDPQPPQHSAPEIESSAT
jgi:hypothetical protein